MGGKGVKSGTSLNSGAPFWVMVTVPPLGSTLLSMPIWNWIVCPAGSRIRSGPDEDLGGRRTDGLRGVAGAGGESRVAAVDGGNRMRTRVKGCGRRELCLTICQSHGPPHKSEFRTLARHTSL